MRRRHMATCRSSVVPLSVWLEPARGKQKAAVGAGQLVEAQWVRQSVQRTCIERAVNVQPVVLQGVVEIHHRPGMVARASARLLNSTRLLTRHPLHPASYLDV